MSSLINSNDVSGVLAQAWITSLGFVQKPTSEMLDSAKVNTLSVIPTFRKIPEIQEF